MDHPTEPRDHWRVCSICKTPIDFGARYHRCSVSTCNRKRTALTFCSVRCWDAHVPTLRHRDAGAVEETAPSREAWEAEQRAAKPTASAAVSAARSAGPTRRVVAPAADDQAGLGDDVPRDILIVASKLKKYITARSGLRTSDGVMPLLSDLVRAACDEAIRRARESERSTVLDRDMPRGWRPD
jgi:hypothetical protein